jgi:predicted dehydrogenase
MMKVAIVGCGKIADGHVEQIQKLPELARVVAVCDREGLMAEQLAQRYGVPAHYDDFEELLAREKPEVVHITTPPASHLVLGTQSLEAGAHLYVEKPVTPTHAETAKLIALCERANKKLTVGYTYLFDPPALAMRELIAEGAIGEVVHVESYYGYNLAGPYGSAIMADADHWVHRLPGGLLQNNIDHLLNKLVEFFPDDDPIMHAFGYRRRRGRHGDARDQMHDELRLMLQGDAASASGVFSSHIRPAAHYQRVFGTKNILTADFVSRTVTLESQASLPSAIGRLVPAFEHAIGYAREGFRNVGRFARSDFHFFAGLVTLIERFYRSILDDGPVPIPHRDILWVSARLEDVVSQLAEPIISGSQEVAS